MFGKIFKRTKPPVYRISESSSVVSHQLKTPLSVTKGYLEELLSGDLGPLNSEQKEYLEDALKNTKRMIILVKDFLDVSRIEQGRLEFKIQLTDLKVLVEKAIEEFALLAKAKNCVVNFKTSGEIPLLQTDSTKIKEVIDNLISNAISYNKMKGEVDLILKRSRNYVIFCCSDTGIGISEEQKKKIFSKFYRAEEALSQSPGGSGLGLFIAKAIIEKSGGKIWFESKVDKGTKFCFSLPIKQ